MQIFIAQILDKLSSSNSISLLCNDLKKSLTCTFGECWSGTRLLHIHCTQTRFQHYAHCVGSNKSLQRKNLMIAKKGNRLSVARIPARSFQAACTTLGASMRQALVVLGTSLRIDSLSWPIKKPTSPEGPVGFSSQERESNP